MKHLSLPAWMALLLCTSMCPASAARADEVSGVSEFNRSAATPKETHLSVGVGAEILGGIPGLGAAVTSPFSVSNIIAVRVSFIEFANYGGTFAKLTNGSLNPSTLVKLGPVFALPTYRESLRLSLATGVSYSYPSATYSTQTGLGALKGYLTLETEYLPRGFPDFSLYLDVGAIQASHADRYSPTLEYANGLDASIGMRNYF